MRHVPIRSLLLLMGMGSATVYLGSFVAGHKPDDSLLIFAGSMFTTYALTEQKDSHDDRDDHDGDRKPEPPEKPS